MSVILCEDVKGYARIANTIKTYIPHLRIYMPSLEKINIQDFVYNLYVLNHMSFNYRYNEYIMPVPKNKFLEELRQSNEIYKTETQFLKSLKFLRYQIYEFEEIEEEAVKNNEKDLIQSYKEAYKLLNYLIDAMKDYIISEYTDYENAKWDI